VLSVDGPWPAPPNAKWKAREAAPVLSTSDDAVKDDQRTGQVHRRIRYADAWWRAVTISALASADGRWFDDRLRLHPGINRHLERLRDDLYAKIFLADNGRDTNPTGRRAALEAFLANLMDVWSRPGKPGHQRALVIHLRKGRWTDSELSYAHAKKVFDYFRENQLIQTRSGFLNCRTGDRRVTRMMPSQSLLHELRNCLTRNEAEYYVACRPDVPVLLKDADGHVVKLPETRFTRKLVQSLRHINCFHGSLAMSYERPDTGRRYPLNPFVYAVFNGDLKTAGRYYGSRNSHVNLPEAQRRTILIEGQPIAELDFRSLHLHLLYAKAGMAYEGDPYKVVLPSASEELRDEVLKKVLLCLLNDRCSEKQLLAHLKLRPTAEVQGHRQTAAPARLGRRPHRMLQQPQIAERARHHPGRDRDPVQERASADRPILPPRSVGRDAKRRQPDCLAGDDHPGQPPSSLSTPARQFRVACLPWGTIGSGSGDGRCIRLCHEKPIRPGLPHRRQAGHLRN
jgi:hypothetical protein